MKKVISMVSNDLFTINHSPGDKNIVVCYKGKSKKFNINQDRKKLEKKVAKFVHAKKEVKKKDIEKKQALTCRDLQEIELKRLDKEMVRAIRIDNIKRGAKRAASWVIWPLAVVTLPITIPVSIVAGKREDFGFYLLELYRGL